MRRCTGSGDYKITPLNVDESRERRRPRLQAFRFGTLTSGGNMHVENTRRRQAGGTGFAGEGACGPGIDIWNTQLK